MPHKVVKKKDGNYKAIFIPEDRFEVHTRCSCGELFIMTPQRKEGKSNMYELLQHSSKCGGTLSHKTIDKNK